MLKIKYCICLLLICCATLWSCKKSQNFNYKELNELEIKGDNANLSIVQFDTLKINPQISQSKPAGEGFTYQWKIYSVSPVEGIDAKVLSTAQALKAVISYPPLKDGYNLEYKITNSATGVSTFKIYTVRVNSAFGKGWLVSNTTSGNAQLSFIRSDYRVFYNPAGAVNQATFPGNAIAANLFYNNDGSRFGLSFFTDKGSYRFGANDFLVSGKSTISFTPLKDKFAFSVSKFTTEEYLINDGSLYAASMLNEPASVTYSARLEGDYNLFPKVITSALFSTYFYDNKYKRFMYVPFGSFSLIPTFGSPSAPFNIGDTRMLMVGAMDGLKTNSSEDFFFVMQDTNGDRFLYSLSGASPRLNQKMLNSPEIASAKSFAASLALRQIYYATDNSIYLYDILANSAKLLYTFPSGTQIKQIQMDQTDSKTLVVAANQTAGGSVYFFKISNLGTIVNGTYDQKIDGFGEISSISYRRAN
ncbi:PKD-like family lipoprotein [uncultured Pedobacter sp.]|uniref:PKD-like family lipoprotein n=1 Tax=uncultured Pedobacter sp. TaxID=246139 RepID=UPI0025D81712|nr:PKD-like family lipoprotein [uncultured Pedobacter sp.]